MMHPNWTLMATICVTIAGLSAPMTASAAVTEGPCVQITAACQQAGFVQGGVKQGNGLQVDCVEPIMQGQAQPHQASKPLPQIDRQLVTACKAANPRFGQRTAPSPKTARDSAPARSPAPTVIAQNGQTRALPTQGDRPNIVFILTDDLAWNLVQYMPHVLKMQKEGATFANYFVTDSLCCPSRSSIFTGRYPHDTGVFRNTGNDGGYLAFLNRGHEEETFAVALSAAGYRTDMLGKYLNGYLPAKHSPAPGWTSWAVAGNGYPEFNYNLNQDDKVLHYGDKPVDYLTDVLSGLSVRFIRQSAMTPFLIEIATFAPHAPYTPAPRDADAQPGVRAPRTPAFDAAPDANAPRWLQKHRALSTGDIAGIDRDFRKRAQSVIAVDKMIGDVQAAVAAMGEANNTYFIFSSDNGYHMGEHRLMPGKMTAYDTDIHVPLVVTGPGVPAGLTVEEIVENIDLYPTFTELAGARTAVNVDGLSLVPFLHGQKVTGWRTVALVEHHGPVKDPADPDLPAIRSGNPTAYEAIRSLTSLYVEYADSEKEYHDLAAEPNELRNSYALLSDDEKASLHATLAAAANCHDAKSCSVTHPSRSAMLPVIPAHDNE
jgi:N-acetylglucosamine-6-sulfatase